VSGGEFTMVPTETGPRLRGRIKTDSFSFWGVAFCLVKVAAHHIQIGQAPRKLRFIVYSSELRGSYPIPKDMNNLLTFKGTYAPMLSGFFTFQHNEGLLVLKHGLDYEIQLECDGVLKSSSVVRNHQSSLIVYKQIDVDVQDIAPGTSLQVEIQRKSTARVFARQTEIGNTLYDRNICRLICYQ